MMANEGAGRKHRQSNGPAADLEPGHTPLATQGSAVASAPRNRDMSVRDEALSRAVRLNVVQELADEMAHDLNNVLTVIAGSLQLYLMQQGGETAQQHFVRNAIEAALRGAQMTGNLLAYARPQVFETGVIELATIVAGVAPLLRETLGGATALDIVAPQPGVAHLVVADGRFIESALLALAQLTAKTELAEVPSRQTASDRPRQHMTIGFGKLSGREAQLRSGAIRSDAECAELTISCESGTSVDAVRQALRPTFGTAPKARPLLDLSAAYASVRQCDGDIGVAAFVGSGPSANSGFTVSILLPAPITR